MDDVIRDEINISKTQKPKILKDEQRKQEKNDKIIEDNKQEKKTMYFFLFFQNKKKLWLFFLSYMKIGWLFFMIDGSRLYIEFRSNHITFNKFVWLHNLIQYRIVHKISFIKTYQGKINQWISKDTPFHLY